MRIGTRVLSEESAFLALDPVLAIFVDRFKARHQLFTERVLNRRERKAALRHLRAERRICHAELLTQLLQGWNNVPSVGATFERTKTREEVYDQRLALCPAGRPHREFASSRLIEIGNGMLRYLTGDYPLARAWPPEHLERLERTITALKAAELSVATAFRAQKDAFLALHRERRLWTRDLEILRDNALKLADPDLEADRFKALFTDWTQEKPATTRKKAARAEDARRQEEEDEEEGEDETTS